MSIKINSLQLENVKRVKAVQLKPSPSGLTIIGGNNGQGKTSVLDAIAWVLGGNKFKPSEPRRDGSELPPNLHVKMDNGLVVERKGKNSDLKVIDPSGNKAGQNLLDEFIDQFALNLPKFMAANNKEKANTLLQIIGVGDKLFELDNKEESLYNQRRSIGQIRDQKESSAAEMESYPDAPEEPVSVSELIKQQQEILAKNGENQKKRMELDTLKTKEQTIQDNIRELKDRLLEAETDLAKVQADLKIADKTVSQLQDESTAEIEKSISDIESINHQVNINKSKAMAEEEANSFALQYNDLSTQIENIRQEKTELLNAADLPLPELMIQDGELTYKGYKWDNLSGSDQLKVSTAIVRKLNPECGFVLLDKLEAMDTDTLKDFGNWLTENDLQVIATRVSTGEECQIIITDGYGSSDTPAESKGDDDPWT